MKHLIHKILALALVAMFVLSCGDKDPAVTSENPLNAYLTNAALLPADTAIDEGYYEFGYSFKPTVKGNLTDFVVKLPDSAQNLRITLWDVATSAVVRSEVVPLVTPNKAVTLHVVAVPLVSGKEYLLTFNSDDWYNYYRTDETDIPYPITAGNIIITGYAYIDGTDQTYPTIFPTDYYAGDLSFVFQASK